QFLRVAWYRRATLIAILVVVALLSGLYAATATRYYQAQAAILILQNRGDELVPSMAAAMSNQDVMPTYEQLVTKAVVLEEAIARLRPEHLVDLRGEPREKWVTTLAGNLKVQSIRRTKLIEIRYRSLDPAVAVAVTQAVIESYLDFIDRTHRGTAREVIDVLRQEKDKVQNSLRDKQTQLLAVRQAAGDIGVRAGGQVLHPVVQTAISLNEALIEAQKQRMEYQATLEAIQNAVRHGEDLQQHLLAVEEVVGREILMAGLGINQRDARLHAELEQSLLADGAELRALSEHYGPNHPHLAEIQHRIQNTQHYLQAYQQRVAHELTELQSNQLGPMLVQMLQQSV
nr:hypothetical protein [Planctomycetales bacterium]NIP70439.1 hypothetical protein [Planctomycetales bacterium]